MKYINIIYACLLLFQVNCSNDNGTAQGILMYDNEYYYVYESRNGKCIIDSLLYDSSQDLFPYILINKIVDDMAEVKAKKNVFEDSPYIHGWMNLNELYTFPRVADRIVLEKPCVGAEMKCTLEADFYRILKIKHGWLYVVDPENSSKRGWLSPEQQYNDMRPN